MSKATDGRARAAGGAWLLAAAALVALRIPHLLGPLDDPHSWRQCDTAYYSLEFFRRGIDLLHPSVCWLGAHRTLIFEFALPEALSALLYRAFGPDPLWDRLVNLGFFLLAAFYLFAFARLVASRRVARLCSLAYLAFPLGQFYSRTAHVDFAATAFAHALLFHAALAFRRRSAAHAAAASGAGALAALIKAPYLIPVLGPLAVAALAVPGLATVGLGSLALGVPAIAFLIWRRHVDAVNGAAPDWQFLPGYYKELNPWWWYVGSMAQRLEPGSWWKLARRLVLEVATPLGSVLALAGLAWRQPRQDSSGAPDPSRPGALACALAWMAATAAYLLVFFPLNLIHNYYQIPFLGPAALLVGLGADLAWERLPAAGRLRAGALAFAAFLVAAVWMVRPLGYYRVDWLRIEAGRQIAERVPHEDLVVACDFASGYSDPRLLARADRLGWSVAIPDLTPARVQRLEALGARWVAVVTDPDHPRLSPPPFLGPRRIEHAALARGGRTLGALDLYRLEGPAAESGPGGPREGGPGARRAGRDRTSSAAGSRSS